MSNPQTLRPKPDPMQVQLDKFFVRQYERIKEVKNLPEDEQVEAYDEILRFLSSGGHNFHRFDGYKKTHARLAGIIKSRKNGVRATKAPHTITEQLYGL